MLIDNAARIVALWNNWSYAAAVIRKQIKLEGLKIHACVLREAV